VTERKQYRFALGSSDDQLSSAWRLWTQGDEAYLATRTFVSVAKLSMHSNGYWQFGIEKLAVPYRRPASYRTGWVRGPGVLIHHNDLDLRLPYYQPSSEHKITWLRQPLVGHVAQFGLRFVDPTVSKRAMAASEGEGTELIAVLRLRTLGHLCVFRTDRPITIDEAAQVAETRRVIESKHPVASDQRVFGMSNISVQPDSHGQSMLTETQVRPLSRSAVAT
jgi:hypothetical protein